MNSCTLSALFILNDLRHAALEALARHHKHPALLLFYSFIDICARLAWEPSNSPAQPSEPFKNYLSHYARFNWSDFSPYDLWASRGALLHTYSPVGDLTRKPDKPKGGQTIFYFAWPETERGMRTVLKARGCADFLLVDVTTVEWIAVSAFNALWCRLENDSKFESVFEAKAQHLVRDSDYIRLEQEFTLLEDLARMRSKQRGD